MASGSETTALPGSATVTDIRQLPPIPNSSLASYRPPDTSLDALLRPGCCMSGMSAVRHTLAPETIWPSWRTVSCTVVPSGRGGLGVVT
jgi:hypothetical protein